MEKGKSSFLSVILLLFILSCSDNNSNDVPLILNPLDYHEELNISYGNYNDQKFDLYLPSGRNFNTKVIILIHGGGWTSGDKIDMNGFKNFIREELPNIAIVNMNYRLADPDNPPYPMQIDDITTVINYLKANQIQYNISDDFGFIGVSAGAHLSLLWSYAFDSNDDVKMACSIVGPTNFTDPAYLENEDSVLQEILDVYGVDTSIEFLEEVSPYHRLSANAPPTILFYGGLDPLIPVTQGTGMRDHLSANGIPHEFTLYPFGGHGWIGPDLLDTSIKLKAFIQTYLIE